MDAAPGGVVGGRWPWTGEPVRVTVEDGLVTAVGPGRDEDRGWLAPGLVDLQVNGFGGHDLNAAEPAADEVVALTYRLAAEGVTTFVPTLVTASHAAITRRLQAVAAARRADPVVAAAIPYVHLEGPHLSDQDGPRGVHDPAWIRPPSIAELEAWQQDCGGLVGMVTLSPHFAGSVDYIRAAVAGGVRVAVGHTHAEPAQVRAAAAAGATLATHLGNGCHATLPRHPNYLWAQLAEDRLTAGFIADGHHLPDDTLRAMVRAKGPGGAVLVSDAVALAGSPPGRYRTPVGGQVQLHPDGRLTPVGDTILAGAARSLADGVAHAAEVLGLGLGDALDLATRAPGRFVGGRGQLDVGARADLFTFDWDPGAPRLQVQSTWIGGRRVHPRS